MSVTGDIPTTTDLLGKIVTDLEDIEVENRDIIGTLNYVTDYTGFSGDPAYQTGHYLALSISSSVEGATIKAKLKNEVTLDPDGIVIFYVDDTSPSTITVTATKQGYDTTVQVYDISGLTLATQ